MLISVIIPIYNVEQYLHECVDSVLRQSYKNIEVILVDDGSPDNCPNICDEYAIKDYRVRVIHKQNGGLSDARNAGLKNATGEYVIFLDSDDYYISENFIEAIAEATDKGRNDAVFFQRTIHYEDRHTKDVNLRPYNLEWNKLSCDDILYELSRNDKMDANASMKATKLSILRDNELFFKKGIFSEDIEWFCRFITCINSLRLINRPDYLYRKREGSITNTKTEKNLRDLFYSVQTYSNLIRNSSLNDYRKKAILNYLAYQYYISIGLASILVKGNVRKLFLDECKLYKWLCDYSISNKTKRCEFLLKYTGIKLGSYILGYYIERKQK